MKKEAITHGVLEDLANRNENWDKLDGVINQVNELEESRLILKNLIENGDFTNGTAGWTWSPTRIQVELDGNTVILITDKKLLDGRFNWFSPTLITPLNKTDIFCISVKAMRTTAINDFGFSVGFSHEERVPLLPTMSVVNTVLKFNLYNPIWPDISFGTVTDKIEVVIDSVNVFNLTQTFGAGNEPTKEEMDIIMDIIGYFNGEHTITSKEQFNILLKMVRENALATTSLGGGF